MQRSKAACAVVFMWLSLSGCAILGGGPADDRVASIKRSKNYHVAAPKNWISMDRADSDLAFRLSSGSVSTVTSSCEKDTNQPLELLTKHLLLGARKVQIVRRESIPVDGTTGLYSHIKAFLEGRQFELHLFVLTRNRCVFDFSLMSPSRVSDNEISEFMEFIKSIRYESE